MVNGTHNKIHKREPAKVAATALTSVPFHSGVFAHLYTEC